ncbi:GTP-sensing pleiotropic transcriptional regulator CodY [Bacillus benzoevorans]|uniref:Global transcriptional regulator CodY n=1 Tax=Bacillus benzoevorans TaxID=1456 RepID=A0A7X0HU37_9BACI|nr:GTP-sensing pleiotropic transcriptional regulator CodY [Bacillus benzoevorans]MBB6446899.1 transcriptional pleiotropic repressor [Bacillus benzoevorans]
MELLANLREINALLQKSAGKYINFDKISEIVSDSLKANVFIISRRGRLLGYAENLFKSEPLERILAKRQLPGEYIDSLLQFRETNSIDMDQDHSTVEMLHLLKSRFMTIVPIVGGEKRLGTLVIAKSENSFHDEDLILAEYGATIVGIKMLHLLNEEAEEEVRSQRLAHKVVSSLSYSELEAVECVINQLKAKEGLLVASRIAEQFSISRSIVVSAIRKLKGSGLVDSKSLGMKGTYLKILNDHLLTELEEAKHSSRVYDKIIG